MLVISIIKICYVKIMVKLYKKFIKLSIENIILKILKDIDFIFLFLFILF